MHFNYQYGEYNNIRLFIYSGGEMHSFADTCVTHTYMIIIVAFTVYVITVQT